MEGSVPPLFKLRFFYEKISRNIRNSNISKLLYNFGNGNSSNNLRLIYNYYMNKFFIFVKNQLLCPAISVSVWNAHAHNTLSNKAGSTARRSCSFAIYGKFLSRHVIYFRFLSRIASALVNKTNFTICTTTHCLVQSQLSKRCCSYLNI